MADVKFSSEAMDDYLENLVAAYNGHLDRLEGTFPHKNNLIKPKFEKLPQGKAGNWDRTITVMQSLQAAKLDNISQIENTTQLRQVLLTAGEVLKTHMEKMAATNTNQMPNPTGPKIQPADTKPSTQAWPKIKAKFSDIKQAFAELKEKISEKKLSEYRDTVKNEADIFKTKAEGMASQVIANTVNKTIEVVKSDVEVENKANVTPTAATGDLLVTSSADFNKTLEKMAEQNPDWKNVSAHEDGKSFAVSLDGDYQIKFNLDKEGQMTVSGDNPQAMAKAMKDLGHTSVTVNESSDIKGDFALARAASREGLEIKNDLGRFKGMDGYDNLLRDQQKVKLDNEGPSAEAPGPSPGKN